MDLSLDHSLDHTMDLSLELTLDLMGLSLVLITGLTTVLTMDLRVTRDLVTGTNTHTMNLNIKMARIKRPIMSNEDIATGNVGPNKKDKMVNMDLATEGNVGEVVVLNSFSFNNKAFVSWKLVQGRTLSLHVTCSACN